MQRDEESKWLMRKIVDIKEGMSGLMQSVDVGDYNIFDSVLGEATGFFLHFNEFLNDDIKKDFLEGEIINERKGYVYSL